MGGLEIGASEAEGWGVREGGRDLRAWKMFFAGGGNEFATGGNVRCDLLSEDREPIKR